MVTYTQQKQIPFDSGTCHLLFKLEGISSFFSYFMLNKSRFCFSFQIFSCRENHFEKSLLLAVDTVGLPSALHAEKRSRTLLFFLRAATDARSQQGK